MLVPAAYAGPPPDAPVEVAPPAADADAADWGTRPLPLRLHPVAWHYGRRYQELLASTLGGESASPVFGPTVAEADVYWRFERLTPGWVPLSEDAPTRWRDTALAGSTLALNLLLDETLARAPQLDAGRRFLDTFLNPNLGLVKEEQGPLQVVHATGGEARRRIERAELADTPPDDRKPTPHFALGVDWDLRSEDDPPRTPLLGYGAWLSLANLGLTNLRAEVSASTQSWSLSARERVYPRTYLFATAASAARAWQMSQYTVGLLWALPPGPAWSLRVERQARLLATPDQEAGYTWKVTLRGELHTPIPAREGAQLGDGGLCLPPLPERAANELIPLNPPDFAPHGPPSCDRR